MLLWIGLRGRLGRGQLCVGRRCFFIQSLSRVWYDVGGFARCRVRFL